jgi:hypothetical protein
MRTAALCFLISLRLVVIWVFRFFRLRLLFLLLGCPRTGLGRLRTHG